MKQLVFLGDILTDEGIKPDERKVSAIMNMERPQNKHDIQRFLGMVTYLAKWIPDLSTKSAPLRILLDKNIQWEWTDKQEKAWKLLKELLTTQPVLQYYDPNKEIMISSDASKDGLGAVILQLHDDKWKPVAYASRSMTDAETRYAQIEKKSLNDCPLRIQRLLLRLQKYDLEVSYTPGKYLVTADAQSRATDKQTQLESHTEDLVEVHVDFLISTMSRNC